MDGTHLTDHGIPDVTNLIELGRTPATATYRGTDTATGRAVVVKVLQRDATAEVRARFDYDQARLVELAEHPNIVGVLRHGYTFGNLPYVVTEVVEGGSMADLVGSGLDGPGVLDLGIRIAGALESAHRRDVVHGDLRPEDVRMDAGGEPEVADFGVVMVTGLGPDRATDVRRLAHAAPEQLQTHLPTPSSDIYALGSALYALLAGGPAFVRSGDVSIAAVGARILNDPPPDLRAAGVPGPVVEAIERAMQKDPAARWSTAEAFGLALQQAQVTLGLPISTMTVIGPDRHIARPVVEEPPASDVAAATATPAKQRRTGLLIGIAAAVVLAVVAGVLLLGGGDDDETTSGRTARTRPDAPDVELRDVSDDRDIVTVGIIDSWSDVDGRPLDDGSEDGVPDLVAAADADAFLDEQGFAVSGIEATVIDDVDDAADLLDTRVSTRGLDGDCTTDLEPRDDEVAGFAGFRQRFEGCDGHALVVFAGVSGGRGLVVEVHLVDQDDVDALEPVLDSIRVA